MSSKLREVLEEIWSSADYIYSYPKNIGGVQQCARDIMEMVAKIKSEPLRNCDVGDVYKQADRFAKFCRKHEKGCGLGWGSKGVGHPKVTCPAYKNIDCGIVWSQMPYEKEGEE